MKFLIQRVNHAEVNVDGHCVGAIGKGLLVLIGVSDSDTKEIADKYIKKLIGLRIFEDENGKILGDCCGEPLRPHDAYKWNVEWTIVLAADAPGRRGIATALYNRFSSTLKKQNFQYIYAVIVDTNEASLGFHKSLGFTEVGHFHNAGIKKGQWLGIVWMNKFIGIDGADAKEPIWYENYKDE